MLHLALYPMNRHRSGFSRNLVGTRSRPGGFRICCGHTILGNFGDFVEWNQDRNTKLWQKARVSEPPTHLLKDPDLPGLQDIFFALVSLTEEDFHSCLEFTTIFTISRCLDVSGEGTLLLQHTTPCFESDFGTDSENA